MNKTHIFSQRHVVDYTNHLSWTDSYTLVYLIHKNWKLKEWHHSHGPYDLWDGGMFNSYLMMGLFPDFLDGDGIYNHFMDYIVDGEWRMG